MAVVLIVLSCIEWADVMILSEAQPNQTQVHDVRARFKLQVAIRHFSDDEPDGVTPRLIKRQPLPPTYHQHSLQRHLQTATSTTVNPLSLPLVTPPSRTHEFDLR